VYAGVLAMLMTPPMALYALSQYEMAEPEGSAPQAAREN
jgi:hypothetical protein